jgi:hypothetical protein
MRNHRIEFRGFRATNNIETMKRYYQTILAVRDFALTTEFDMLTTRRFIDFVFNTDRYMSLKGFLEGTEIVQNLERYTF